MGSALKLIAAGIIVAAGFALPFLQKAQKDADAKKRANARQPLFVEGWEVPGDSPFYNKIANLNETKAELEKSAVTKADDAALELVGILLDSSLESAKYIESSDDYRYYIAMEKRHAIIDKYVFEHIDEYGSSKITNILNHAGWGMDEKYVIMDYFDLDDTQRAEMLETVEDKLEMAYNIEANNDYKAYYRYQINEKQKNIDSWRGEIEALEKDITENPENEELYSVQIESKKNNIKKHQEIDIYLLEYRIEHDILPFFSDWRSKAVDDKRDSMYNLHSSTTLTREEFEENEYYRNEYRTYNAYKKQRQEHMNEASERLLVADRSLETGKPDMKYVLGGPRTKATRFLWYSAVISLFAVMLGGGLISRECKQGTIRLLLIRPKTRVKVIFYKTAALVVIIFALYFASAALNILANGILCGFADYGYPNYTASSGAAGVNFFANYALKFMICFVPVFFLAVLSVFLSAVTKNTAVSVAVPMVLMLGSLIFIMYFMNGMVSQRSLKWFFDTPLPYINMFIFYEVEDYWCEIKINTGYGAGLILALTSAVAAAGALNFKTVDIKN